MVFGSIFRFFQNLFWSVKYSIMGDSSDVKPDSINQVIVPPIPKLGDSHLFWMWRMLIKTYLAAIGLWSRDYPKESPHAKFVLLSTLEIWAIRREYDVMTCRAIFEDLERRYAAPASRTNSVESFM
ncbi:uncharacterized protein LOC119562979 [Drosophila subpulchrella]|uniref:uncharacterized protein LOC119562979 n=1 Tax=Drosophila subpulchrella TaxID=1486046 RepID=UPI0018A194FA|nr:uncharacterized protein LOC119562979 [Drosophila subpulchrella]